MIERRGRRITRSRAFRQSAGFLGRTRVALLIFCLGYASLLGIALIWGASSGSFEKAWAAAVLAILVVSWVREPDGRPSSAAQLLLEGVGLTFIGVRAGGPIAVLLLLYARQSSFALSASVRRAVAAFGLYSGIYAAVVFLSPPNETSSLALVVALGSGFPLVSTVLCLLGTTLTRLESSIARERATTEAVASLLRASDLSASLEEVARLGMDAIHDDVSGTVELRVEGTKGPVVARSLSEGMEDLYPPGHVFRIAAPASEEVSAELLAVTDRELSDESKNALTTIAHATALAMEREVLTQGRHAEQSEARFQALVQNSSDVIFVVERDLEIRYASSPIRSLVGRSPEWCLGRNLSELIHPRDLSSVLELCENAAPSSLVSPIECRLCREDETWLEVELVGVDLSNDPNVGGVVLTVRDITERRRADEALRQQAFHDQLTGLPNRALFLDRLRHALHRRLRKTGPLVVLFLDLDRFKMVNDSLGHLAGDGVLIEMSRRLRGVLRPGDTVARMGGDEFAILLEDSSETAGSIVASRVDAAMKEPFTIERSDVRMSISIGITVCDVPRDPEEILREADVAMYVAKEQGRGLSEVFRPEMHVEVLKRIQLEDELRVALENDELTVYFQPIVDINTELIIGMEALVRWEHSERGLVSPAEFVPLAEETGQVIALDRLVLERACAQTCEWQELFPGEGPLGVSVNLSGRDLFEPTLVEDVEEVLSRSGLKPRSLTLELTEGVLAEDVEATVARLKALKALGIRLALDDFGTGYSSLSYLQRFPLDVLKVDRSFIAGFAGGPEDSALARAVVKIGRTLRMLTVAEGIETEGQLEELRRQSCHFGQGYYFSRPVAAEEMHELLHRQAMMGARWYHKPGNGQRPR